LVIDKKDILWNYIATFFKLASSLILLPIILSIMPEEKVAFWIIFITISSFAALLDFGFAPSFTRNVTYVFSGVKALKVTGFQQLKTNKNQVDYSLLKALISSMKWFYLRVALFFFLIVVTLGTYYINHLLKSYDGDHIEIYISWTILIFTSFYNLLTLYYDSLLQGKGLIKKSKQIFVFGQLIYLVLASSFLLLGYGLYSVFISHLISFVVIRYLSYQAFFTIEIKRKLSIYQKIPTSEILDIIKPNAIKVGLTSLGGFLVSRSSIIIGSLFVTLPEIASYGISLQVVKVIGGIAIIYLATYQPKIVEFRVSDDLDSIKQIYLKGLIILVISYLAFGFFLFLFGPHLLDFLGSKTQLLSSSYLILLLFIAFLENNHANAGNILLTGNEVPFFKSSLIAGLLTIIILPIMLIFLKLEILSMILAPGIAHLYNNWKWPYEVFKLLKIKFKDFFIILKHF